MDAVRKANQRAHAKKRAFERYNIILTDPDYDLAVLTIIEQRSWFIERKSKLKTVHELIIQGRVVRVGYDNRRQTITTFLPRY